jgi:hypothetical protein
MKHKSGNFSKWKSPLINYRPFTLVTKDLMNIYLARIHNPILFFVYSDMKFY